MKKFLVIAIIFVFSAAPVFAGTLYISGIRAKVYAAPSFKSGIIDVLPRGVIVKELEREKKWVKIRFRNKVGWVSKYLLSAKPPKKRVSILAGADSIEKSSRRRASAFTSVAAARGLTDYDRARRGKESYAVDFDALERMEKIKIDDMEAVRFVEEGVRK